MSSMAWPAMWLLPATHVQVDELAPGVGHAADLGYAVGEALLVAAVVVADQLAPPVAEEVTGVLTAASFAEVVDHRFQPGVGCGGIGPEVGLVCLFLHGGQHRYWNFIVMWYLD